MLQGFSLGNYQLLIDYTGRMFRDGKTAMSAKLSGILERLGTTAAHMRVHHLANIGGCPAR